MVSCNILSFNLLYTLQLKKSSFDTFYFFDTFALYLIVARVCLSEIH